MADKTVLVTGARGQIGRYVAQQFARTPGWRAIGLSRSAIDAPISILTTLKDYGYGGEVHIINPKFPDLAGYHVHASLDDAPPGLDLAVVTVAREQVNDVLRACIKSGIGAAIVITQVTGRGRRSHHRAVRRWATSAAPWNAPHITKLSDAPCQRPDNVMVAIKLRIV